MTTRRAVLTEELQALWKRYHATGDKGLRDRLILTLAPLVKFIVYRKVREMPAHAEAEDFISVGLEALIQSIDRYDPDKGASLEQYAWTRVHGAVLDELRRQDWAPRSVRRWERDIEKAVEEFTALHQRRPTRDELAEALGIERRRSCAATAPTSPSPTSPRSTRSSSPTSPRSTIEQVDTIAMSDERLDPEAETGRVLAKERFRDAFGLLPDREREIAVLLYVKNLTLAEIGEVLGVSESRVCQIHGQTKKKLRAALDEDAALFHLVA